MKPFNLEAAKNGKPVQTRDGKPVRIICFDRKGSSPIVALVTEDDRELAYVYKKDGSYYTESYYTYSACRDLVMAPVKHEGWVYVSQSKGTYLVNPTIYPTTEIAERAGKKNINHNFVTVTKIEWEE